MLHYCISYRSAHYSIIYSISYHRDCYSTDSWEVEQSQWPPTAVALDALKDRIQDGTVSQCIYNGSAAVESDSSTQLKRKRPNGTITITISKTGTVKT